MKQDRKTDKTAETVTPTLSPFDSLKRAYETANANGQDVTAPLLDLSTAVTYSVLNKTIDPQRKAAAERETVTDSGISPALVALKRGIYQDRNTLDKVKALSDRATKVTFTADGDCITVIADKNADKALKKLEKETLSDGIDLVQTAALAILEMTAEHAAAGGDWLDRPFTVRRLAKQVYIQSTESAAYKEVETTPIQEVYRAVRREIAKSRATQTDPRNGYLYLEEMTEDGLDTIYRRLGKFADLGGYAASGHFDNPDCGRAAPGYYTADAETVTEYNAIMERLNLTERQAVIVRLRMQGKGYKAIATYLGVTHNAVINCMKKVQAKAAAIGLDPAKLDK